LEDFADGTGFGICRRAATTREAALEYHTRCAPTTGARRDASLHRAQRGAQRRRNDWLSLLHAGGAERSSREMARRVVHP